jgi:hypothetical protein
MKLTKSHLKQIIKEEINNILNEGCSTRVNTWKYQQHKGVELGYTDDGTACACAGLKNQQRCWVNPRTGEVITKNSQFEEIREREKLKKIVNEEKNNPWAICTAQVGREDKEKYERCVKSVKKK